MIQSNESKINSGVESAFFEQALVNTRNSTKGSRNNRLEGEAT